ncbi:MAG: ankyrin repeat domain-containing protein [Candidatus Zixiibacteriota bacterium]
MSDLLVQISDGRTDLVFDYLSKGNKVTAIDNNGVSLIKWCAYYGDVSAIRFLMANGESLKSLGANFDLNGAVFHGHWRLTQFLIEHGADVNFALPETGETPLHNALCRTNNPVSELIIRVLLAKGADPNCRTKKSAATGSFMRDCRTKGETPLHRAAAFGSAGVIQQLIDAGAIIDAKDMNGDSPLGWASRYNRPAYILKLLCYGEFSIHPDAVKRSLENTDSGRSNLELNLLGKPHI